jgi:hypothetical protein
MTDSRTNLHGCPGIVPAAQPAMLNACSALLEHLLDGTEVLIIACRTWQGVMLHREKWSMPDGAEDEDWIAWSLVTTLEVDLVVSAHSIPGNPHDQRTGHIRSLSQYVIPALFSPTSNPLKQCHTSLEGLDD